MHPSGVKFGLSLNLLELRGADVVLSDQVFHSVSSVARRRLRGKNRLTASYLWDQVVSEGLGEVIHTFQAPHSESTPFFMGLHRVAAITVMPLAQAANLGLRIGYKDFLLSSSFMEEFDARIKKLEFDRDVTRGRRLLFRACCNTVTALCMRHNPALLDHAPLISLFVFEEWCQAGCVEVTVFLHRQTPWQRTRSNHPLRYRALPATIPGTAH